MKSKLFYLLAAFMIFLASSCGQKKWNFEDDDNSSTTDDDNSPIVAVSPINISLPEANFTNPDSIYNKTAYSYQILNRFIQLVNAVPTGDTIYCSYFLMNDERVINSLIQAGRRGAVVNVLIDSSRTESISQNIVAYQSFLRSKHVRYSAIRNSLMVSDTEHGINHNKYLAISAIETTLGRKEHIVFQTSNNMTQTQCSYFQDNFILQDQGLYNTYRHNWTESRKYAKGDMDLYTFQTYLNTQTGIEAYFFPKIKNGVYYDPDPIIDILGRIQNPSTSTVRILMYTWSAARITIINKLSELISKGAKVEVMVCSDESASSILSGLENLSKQGAFVRTFPLSSPIKKSIHSKYMLIEGTFDNKQQSIVFTGSENYTTGALKQNLESLIGVSNSPIYAKYLDNFYTIKNL